MEKWKSIPKYEGFYEASTDGRIRSIRRTTTLGGVLKHNKSRFYMSICLSARGSRRDFSVHRIIASTFIPSPNKKPYVNHKDGNKFNNSVNNLEWCTSKENRQHAIKNGFTHSPRGEKHWAAKLTESDVIELRLKRGHKTLKQIAREYGVSTQLVSDIINRKRWKHI